MQTPALVLSAPLRAGQRLARDEFLRRWRLFEPATGTGLFYFEIPFGQ